MYEKSSSPNNVKVVRTQHTSGAGMRSAISGGSRPPALVIDNKKQILSYARSGKQYTSEILSSNVENENKEFEDGITFNQQHECTPKNKVKI